VDAYVVVSSEDTMKTKKRKFTYHHAHGGWVNTKYFTTAADTFEKYGYYVDAPEGTREYFQFWDRERDRIVNGYCVGGKCITGSHYFYLNYTRIRKSGTKGRKRESFPDFWDGDYDFFWNWEIVRNGYDGDIDALELFNKPLWLDGGHHMLVVKARQKGFSYKAAAIATREYNFFKNSNTFIGAYVEDYASANFAKVMNNIHHINEHTAFIKRRQVIDRQDHIRASYLERDEEKGVDIEKGYKSEVIVKSFHENKNATRGGSYDLVIIEEAGSFGPPGTLKQVISSTRDTLEEGAYVTGNMLVFGTSGEMDKGSVDLSELAYMPDVYNFVPYTPVWDDPDDHETKTVYFFPAHLCLPGYIDEHGNSDLKAAKEYEESKRKKYKDAGKIADLIAYKAERPMKLSEAFDVKSGSFFSAIVEIKVRLEYLKHSKIYEKITTPVELYYDEDGTVHVREASVNDVIWEFKHYPDGREGTPVIYEMPEDPLAPYQYIIAYDPYRHDQGTSLGAAYVYKTSKVFSYTHDTIVASYIGRPKSFNKYNDTLIKLAELYKVRLPVYQELADITINANRNSIRAVIEDIQNKLKAL